VYVDPLRAEDIKAEAARLQLSISALLERAWMIAEETIRRMT
jgi:hypothetical protein